VIGVGGAARRGGLWIAIVFMHAQTGAAEGSLHIPAVFTQASHVRLFFSCTFPLLV
jgi:hypothetical protein